MCKRHLVDTQAESRHAVWLFFLGVSWSGNFVKPGVPHGGAKRRLFSQLTEYGEYPRQRRIYAGSRSRATSSPVGNTFRMLPFLSSIKRFTLNPDHLVRNGVPPFGFYEHHISRYTPTQIMLTAQRIDPRPHT